MVRRLAMLSALFSLFTGCARKPAEITPAAPGVSVTLSYPVLLAGERNLVVKDDELNLTTTTGASGLNFPEYKLIDSGGMQYAILKATPFGRKSAVLDMGTGQYRVFLQMKSDGKIDLSKAKTLALGAALAPHGVVSGTDHGAELATRAIQGTQSIAELIQVCRKTWEWR